ncbi:MAG TPA: universal stress protein [Mycobacteriales bacterium]|nr:universal stress protein [Mycobacteriales bacterium]
MTSADRSPIVVVGIDGSTNSELALRWAEAYAVAAGYGLRLVCAWQVPTSFGHPVPHEGYEPVVAAREVAEKAATGVAVPPERVETLVPMGPAGEVLVEVSRGAALLVVGHRGHTAIGERLPGSVSAYCVHHAHVPVVVVPSARPR